MKTAIASEKLSLLELANNCLYDFGCGDASDALAKLNLQYGLGKIAWSLKKRNINATDLVAVTTPDSGITRNKERWQAGFSYGCLIRWPSKSQIGFSLAFPQIKPNACGMLVAKLNKAPSIEELCEKLHKAEKSGLAVNSSKLKLNVGVSNHFIEICRVDESQSPGLNEGDIVAVIHTSPSEYKSVLYDFKGWFEKGGSWDETPLGPLLVLEGELADEYINSYKNIEEFGSQKRLTLAGHLFDEFETISNPTHQGLFEDNEIRLGLYRSGNKNELFPVTFRWDLHVYLMKALPNLSQKSLEGRKIDTKTSKLLRRLNMLPHGGGYEIPFQSEGWKVVENGSKRLFSYKNTRNEFIFTSPSEIPYYYRGLKVIDKIAELELGSIAAKLKQIYTLKY